MTNPIYVALDTPDCDRAVELANAVAGHVGGVKLGLEFFCAQGHHGVHEVQKTGLPIFLDLKLHDIPNTVARAMQAINLLEPAIVTVHAAGGRAMMEDAKAAANEHTKVVGVTLLTSLDGPDVQAIGFAGDPADQVARLASLAQEAGLDGVVCSGSEVAAIRQDWKTATLVVPGLRPKGSASADQKRSVTPAAARDAGADILVIGRPITGAPDPLEAARMIEGSL